MSESFFQMVAEAAFSNPFGARRVEADRRIVGASADAGWHDMLAPLLSELARHLDELGVGGRIKVRPEGSEQERAVAVGVLFHVFHQYMEHFDRLIEQQIEEGDEPCPAPFAMECTQALCRYGYGRADALRYVGMFYQIRRAYFFISRTLVGASPCMRNFRARLWDNIFTHDIAWYERCLWNRMEDFSTLLLGETGTGKGAAAAAVGRSGFIPYNPNTWKFAESFTSAFVSINLSQYPETLIESELFGHRKGAFTGAIEQHDGVFARCSPYGAIFLDEIGDVGIPVQIKLLQVLQERTFTPVGSHEKLRFKGRVIAATNRSLDQLRRAGSFRDDFYYRLCSDLITVPSLRQRLREDPAELEALTEHIMQRICGQGLGLPVYEILKRNIGRNYAWPGNVRELEQAIRRIMLTGTYGGDRSAASAPEGDVGDAMQAGQLSAKDLVARYCRDLHDRFGNYGEVARRTGLDWRTVKKYVSEQHAQEEKR